MVAKQRSKWWVDAVLFSAFVIEFFLDLTGLDLHQWLGLAAGLFAGYHLIVHRTWVSKATRFLFNKATHQSQAYYLVDALLALGFNGIIITGLAVSPWFSLVLDYGAWVTAHIAVSMATLAAVLLKIALHWRWIFNVGRGMFSQPKLQLATEISRGATNRAPIGRREFFRVMGFAGVVSVPAMVESIRGLQRLVASTKAPVGETGTKSSPGSACQIACNLRCTTHGKCSRYIDANSNGRCDLGECA